MSTQDTYNLATGAGLIACPRCDALHIEEELSLGETARCIRCGGVLARPQGGAFTQIIALAITTMVLVFAAGTAVVTAWYGRGWAAALAGSLPGGSAAAGWCGLALGCLLLNWGSGVLRQRVGGHLRPLV